MALAVTEWPGFPGLRRDPAGEGQQMVMLGTEKRSVRDFWEQAPCSETYVVGDDERAQFEAEAKTRYALEPHLKSFARFWGARGRDVLEIGVGCGSDHVEWAHARPRSLTGLDLTRRAVETTQRRLSLYRLESTLRVLDAENLPFEDESFDIVYAYGVLHHSPDTQQAVREVHRVLRPGGVARIMIYHTWSLTGLMLWARYAMLTGKPFTSLRTIYARHLESPGTKAYTVRQARTLFSDFARARISIQLNHGDLLQGEVGQRHRGSLLRLARKIWPRPLIRLIFPFLGLYLLIEANK